jgi:hypothetical protein
MSCDELDRQTMVATAEWLEDLANDLLMLSEWIDEHYEGMSDDLCSYLDQEAPLLAQINQTTIAQISGLACTLFAWGMK